MSVILYRIGRFAARRPWAPIVAWALILVLAATGYLLFHGPLSTSISIPDTPTQQTADELQAKFPNASGGSGTLVFSTTDGKAFTPSQKAAITSLLDRIAKLHGVKATTNPFTTQSELAANQAKLASALAQLESAQQQLAAGQAQISQGRQQLQAAQQQLTAAEQQAQLAGDASALQSQFAQQQAQLDQETSALTAKQTALQQEQQKLASQEQELKLQQQLLTYASEIKTVSTDASAALGIVSFPEAVNNIPQPVKTSVLDAIEGAGIAGVQINASDEIAQSVPSILGPGEAIGLLIAAITLFIMLGTFFGAALPLISSVTGVAIASATLLAFSGRVEMISVTPVLGVMLGLAVGIDYSLFILNRHRNQLRRGVPTEESIGLANGTSGNAVLFAGATVLIALLALNLVGVPFLGLMGTAGAIAVATAILIATTLTPAFLSLLGTRLLPRRVRHEIGKTAPARAPETPMPTWRAVLTLVAGVAVLGIIAIPTLSMRLGLPDGASDAPTSTDYRAYQIIEQRFGAGVNGPLLVVATLPHAESGNALLTQEVAIAKKLRAQEDVRAVAPIGASADGTVLAYQVIPSAGPDAAATGTLVRDLRGLSPLAGNIKIGVAGTASGNIDISQKLADALPLYLAVVLGLSLVILIFVFRSLLVPLTATLGFALSLAAAFGGLTAIYQWGWLGGVFDVHTPSPILSFLPTIQVGVLFGLAMDYQLFIVSGMREAKTQGWPARIAVQRGLHAGRTVVLAAATIMTAVFAGFIFSDSSMVRPIGFALALGVLLDAFVVRLLLVPAAMHLMGEAAWWFPRWLDRILPNVDVEGSALEAAHAHREEAAEQVS